MSGEDSESWNPAVGDRRTVRLKIERDGSPSIIAPNVTKAIDIQAEFEHPAGSILKADLEVTDAGIIEVSAEPRGSVTVQQSPATQAGPSRQELIDELRRIAADIGETPTTNDLMDHGEYDREWYFDEFGSFIDALEEANLQPRRRQYRFSDHETPDEMQGTMNTDYLEEHGPATVAELPADTGYGDKRHGAAKFSMKGGQVVYYLMNTHDPEDVIRKYLDENPSVVEQHSQQTLTMWAGEHGKSFKSAAKAVVEEYKSDE